jgi:hypothetical protein
MGRTKHRPERLTVSNCRLLKVRNQLS